MNTLEVAFDKNIYSKESILKAAHKFSAVCTADITEDKATNSYKIYIKFNDGIDNSVLDKKIFNREVLDNELRLNLSSQTEGVKNLIIAQAFSKTNLISDGSKE